MRVLLPVLRATRSTHALAPSALAQLEGFDGTMRADRPAPLILAVWGDELTRGVIAPRLGQDKFKALYGKRSFRQGLEIIMADPQAGAAWCAPVSCAEQSAKALDRALDRIAALVEDVLPEGQGYRFVFSGESEEFYESGAAILFAYLLAVVAVYLVLAAQFESFRHPAIILVAVALSFTGALVTLWVTGNSLNLFSQIGLVMLVVTLT